MKCVLKLPNQFDLIDNDFLCEHFSNITLHILVAGTVLKVLKRLAETPGGGSNTNTLPALNKLVGIYKIEQWNKLI